MAHRATRALNLAEWKDGRDKDGRLEGKDQKEEWKRIRLEGINSSSLPSFQSYLPSFQPPLPIPNLLSMKYLKLSIAIQGVFCLLLELGVVLAVCAAKQADHIIINEVLAKNRSRWQDEDGDSSDWIELYNPTNRHISLEGYSLTDDPADLRRWKFPAVTLAPELHLLVWASGKDRREGHKLHTNFKLNRDGEALYLVNPLGKVVDSLTFGAQRTNVSYGRHTNPFADWQYFPNPSPGKPNQGKSYLGIVEPPTCTLAEGNYPQPSTVAFETSTEGAEIRYALDGSIPTLTHGKKYSAPLTFEKTTVVRARAFKKAYLPSTPITKTYLIGAKHTLPVLSVVAEPADLWGRRGIYNNSIASGKRWERPASATLFRLDGSEHIAFEAGLRIHGGASREQSQKQSFRLYFRKRYGDAVLEAPIFASVPDVSHLKQIVLRGAYNDSWSHRNAPRWNIATYVRDQLVRDLHLDMGKVAARGDFVALYLNGRYWGLYNICERISGDLLSRYLGDGDWDIIKDDWAREGNSIAWKQFKAWYTSVDMSLKENYRALGQKMDIENFTDYFILNTWAHNYDWPHHNWYAARKRDDPNARWFFLVWDAEYAFGGGSHPFEYAPNTLLHTSGSSHTPLGLLFNKLLQNDDYRAYFTARFEKHLAGPLNPTHVQKRLAKRLDQIRSEIPGEAKRWRSSKRFADWQQAIEHVQDFINKRGPYVRRHLRTMPNWLKHHRTARRFRMHLPKR